MVGDPVQQSETARQLLQQVLAEPGSLGARQVYADCLSDLGDPQGEYIALSCRLEDPRLPPAERLRIRSRANTLFATHGMSWTRDLRALPPFSVALDDPAVWQPFQLRAGFVEELCGDATTVLQHLEDACRCQPIRALDLRRASVSDLRALAAHPRVGQLRSLRLHRPEGEELLGPLLAALEAMPHLEVLGLGLPQPLAQGLLSAPALPALRELELDAALDASHLYQLLQWAPGIRRLSARLADDEVDLAALTRLPLEELELHGGRPTGPLPAGLARLALWSTELAAVTSDPVFDTVQDLGLSELEPQLVSLTLRSPELRSLRLRRGNLGPFGLRALTQCRGPTLERLEFRDSNPVESHLTWRQFLASPLLRKLRTLSISEWRDDPIFFDSAGKALARWRGLATLEELRISTLGLSDAVVIQVLRNATGLRSLALASPVRARPCSEAVLQAIAASRLQSIELPECEPTGLVRFLVRQTELQAVRLQGPVSERVASALTRLPLLSLELEGMATPDVRNILQARFGPFVRFRT